MGLKLDWKNVIVRRDSLIIDAVRVLNEGHLMIVMVEDQAGHLLGVVTDSDIRRALLNRVSLDEPVEKIMVKDPVAANINTPDADILSVMREKLIHQIPVINDNGIICGLRSIDDFLERKELGNTVVIMAGGLGKRLYPATKEIPKPLVEIEGKPILFRVMDRFYDCGLRDFVLSINYKGKMIKDAISGNERYKERATYLEEDAPLGTAGSLRLFEKRPDESFFVANADLLTAIDFKAMLGFHNECGYDLTMGVREEHFQLPFGVVNADNGQVMCVEEKPEKSFFVSAGVYVLTPSVIDNIPENQSFDMPDLINALIDNGGKVGSFPLHEYWLDIGGPEHLKKASEDIGKKRI